MIRRIGVIGDVHAEADLLEAALQFLRKAPVDQIVCVGDIVDGKGDVDQCCALLQESNTLVVRGNHDRWFIEGSMRGLPEATQRSAVSQWSYRYLESLPATQVLETTRGRVLLCHGLGTNDMQRLKPDDTGYALEVIDELQHFIRSRAYTFIINGHTHHRMVRTFGPLTVINAGTLYRAHEPCIAIADFTAGHVQFYDFQNSLLVQANKPIPC